MAIGWLSQYVIEKRIEHCGGCNTFKDGRCSDPKEFLNCSCPITLYNGSPVI